jgi:CubicO group peptidase (beta-lactamase class C family)
MVARLIAILVACALCSTAFAQAPGEMGYVDIPEMPTGIEGARVQLLFDAVNMADVDLVKQFYDEAFSDKLKGELPLEGFVQFYSNFMKTVDTIDFHSIREYDPPREDVTVVIFKNMNYDSWMAFSLTYAVGEKPDGKLVGFTINRARIPSDLEDTGPLSQQQAIEQLWPYLDRLCGRDLFSGTVMIAKGDDVLLAASCGEASKRFHAPIDMDTKFNLGSMNKMFTAVACMQLVEKGKLSLDEPISKWVDESWLPKEISDKITLSQLLSHTSGLGDYFNETFEQGSRLRWREIDDYKELIYTDTLAFEPGTDWSYSNAGMFVAGVIVAKASGEDYFDYIRENIYEPAGMDNTDSYDMDCPIENLAIGYWKSDDCASGWKNNYFEHVIRGGPAGGGFSTSPDLLAFARALQTGVLLSEESLDLLWTDHFDPDRTFGYGYGFGIRTGAAGKVVGHGGGFTGINANLDIFLDSGYIAVVMTNYDMAAEPVRVRIEETLARIE